ncbi:hypothetical protein BV898_07957 [Hypsibius exemplaris]|uniref:G-protein coupled receptors family 1 profile domain-containing protein n=1 Tax=Hypsibius exemplaris TaxID=2072580 RepID=A0A1W0WS39_HYPEX|nr:hypothetical protein BV898_07957 [Hypsibius exemplaris]
MNLSVSVHDPADGRWTAANVSSDCFCAARDNGSTHHHHQPTDPIFTPVLYLTVTVSALGFLTNLLLLVLFLNFPSLRRGVGVFIVHLLATQTLFCGAVMPGTFHMIFRAQAGRPVACSTCLYHHTFHSLVWNAAIWTDAILAVNRIVAVCLPARFHFLSLTSVRILIASLGLIPVLVSTVPPLFWNSGVVYQMTPVGLCVLRLQTELVRWLNLLTARSPLVLLAFAVVVVATNTLFVKMQMRRVDGRSTITNPDPGHGVVVASTVQRSVNPARTSPLMKRRQKMSWILAAGFLFTLLCQSPQWLIASWFNAVWTLNPVMPLVWRFCTVLQFAVVPVIFYWMSSDYQTKAGELYDRIVMRRVIT